MFVSKAKYTEACDERDIYKNERDGLIKRLEAGQRIQEADATRIRDLKGRCNDLWAEVAEWKAKAGALKDRLIPFERVRGKGGRFVATPVDPIRAQFENECG